MKMIKLIFGCFSFFLFFLFLTCTNTLLDELQEEVEETTTISAPIVSGTGLQIIPLLPGPEYGP